MATCSMAQPPATELAPATPCPDCGTLGYFGAGDEITNCERCEGDGYIYGPAEACGPVEDWTEAAGAEFAGVAR